MIKHSKRPAPRAPSFAADIWELDLIGDEELSNVTRATVNGHDFSTAEGNQLTLAQNCSELMGR